MSEWLRALVGYMLIVSVSMQMLPKEKYEQYVKLFTGFLLLILVVQPLLKIGSLDGYLENKISEFVLEQERLEQKIGEEKDVFFQEGLRKGQNQKTSIEVLEIEKIEVIIRD